MRPRLLAVLLLNISLTTCVTVNKYTTTIDGKTKIELPPILIECKLNDILVVRAPEINKKDGHYYLYRPSGEVIKLNIPDHKRDKTGKRATDESIIKNDNAITNDDINKPKHKIFNVNHHVQANTTNNAFEEYVKKMDALEFMMGPLAEDDHGNWVLSVFYTDINGDVVELFQVISIEIIENVPAQPSHVRLINGSNFKLRFAYPIKYLESCELRPLHATGDRFYDRDSGVEDSCGYMVPNVTHNDAGIWSIIGVGKIVYEARVYLNVYNKNL